MGFEFLKEDGITALPTKNLKPFPNIILKKRTVKTKQNVPVIRVGRKFTEGIAQINFILIIVDFIIEAPFKGLVGFFEQWFMFVADKREELE